MQSERRQPRLQSRHRPCLWCVCLLILILSPLVGCKGKATPTPGPTPVLNPTATPSVERVLEGALYSITLDGVLLATEEIHVGHADDQVVVFGELVRLVGMPAIERRTVVLSQAANPVRYDLELSALGAHSTWVAERKADSMDVLNNNLAWNAPVYVEGVSPAPGVLLEASPSALPFALLALRVTQGGGWPEDGLLSLHVLDVTEDWPVSRPLSVTLAAEREGAVLGTVALEGKMGGGLYPEFVLWARPNSRVLYRAEIPEFRFGLWQGLGYPWAGDLAYPGASSRSSGRLVIQRVSQAPEVEPSPAGLEAQGEELDFSGSDGVIRRGTLSTPSGDGPFPCLVAHSAGGVSGRFAAASALARHGWAVFAYDKRGLGESEGRHERGRLGPLAEDARMAAEMLAERPDIDAARVVFLGIGEGGQVGALAVVGGGPFAGAILGSCASEGALYPSLVEHRAKSLLAPFYSWDTVELAEYRRVSLQTWTQWLFDGEEDVGFLGRRVSLRGLEEQQDTDLDMVLAGTDVPLLLLHGAQDKWTPVKGARGLAASLEKARVPVSLEVFDDLGADLGAASDRPFAPEVESAVVDWLARAVPGP